MQLKYYTYIQNIILYTKTAKFQILTLNIYKFIMQNVNELNVNIVKSIKCNKNNTIIISKNRGLF